MRCRLSSIRKCRLIYHQELPVAFVEVIDDFGNRRVAQPGKQVSCRAGGRHKRG